MKFYFILLIIYGAKTFATSSCELAERELTKHSFVGEGSSHSGGKLIALKKLYLRHCDSKTPNSLEVKSWLSSNKIGRMNFFARAPILGPFRRQHNRCASSCSYVSWGIWGDAKHRRRRSCHNSGEAIDIHAIRCRGRKYGPSSSRFRSYVSCMRSEFRVIFGRGAHRNHAHMQMRPCRKIRGTFL